MTFHPQDTIVALSSPSGPGGRAIIRITGPNARNVVETVFTPDGEPGKTLTLGSVRLSGVHSPLLADLYFWRAPRTYTGQDLAEFHLLSSPPLVERLIADVLTAGARPAEPGEFTLRAFLAGKKDLTQAEAVQAVVEAGTDRDLKAALIQLAGGVTQPLQVLRNDLLNLLADIEAALDFADEDIEFVAKPQMLARVGAGLAHLLNLRRQFDDRSVSGRAVRIVLVGEPNAGKSSLFNELAGRNTAIVSPVAGTTRDYLVARIEIGGVPVDLIDTAGREEATDTITDQAQRIGSEQSARADLILWCVPLTEDVRIAPPGEVLLVRTKSDLKPILPSCFDPGVRVCAINPNGIDLLLMVLLDKVQSLARPPLAPSQSRCRHHVESAIASLKRAHEHIREDDPPELLALALREALDQVGEMAGVVFTNDLLDRIFSRFCIGK